MERYDPYTDSFVNDTLDDYMRGYLAGCKDTIEKLQKLEEVRLEYVKILKNCGYREGE